MLGSFYAFVVVLLFSQSIFSKNVMDGEKRNASHLGYLVTEDEI